MSGPASPTLLEVLERARSFGFLGPGPVEDHVDHAGRFGKALELGGTTTIRVADIGAGGGVPGLVLLETAPSLEMVLIDASQKRCAFLVWALAELGVDERAEVWCGRAEEIGHEERARERFDAVVARGFGPPPTTLECATGLVRPGGRIVISEPPERRAWPADGLGELALELGPPSTSMAVFVRVAGLDARFPRPARQQQRRPTFDLE